ncbi:DUF3488 and DUF4129 domain-containing transglutaminase family protein [Kitasatospora sp. NPDC050543]|uniref:DUF3488 and DUF4129 domain-containing transglutaminase family protein n=1 Tax=Kitasatospora sp. NPDC050543 TaxID=3364054 RepID=UPI00379D4B3B
MTTRAKLTAYAALATALATLCLTPLLVSKDWYAHALLLIAVVAAAGAGLRRLPIPRWLVPAGQLLVVLYTLMLGFVQPALAGGLLPGPKALDALGSLLGNGVDDISQYAIPAPASPGLRLILVGAVALVALVVDAVAVTFRRSALAGLPLLALYSVGTGLAGGGSGWFWFLLAACGYLVLLFAEGQDRLSRWGRVFHGSGSAGAESPGALSHSGHRVGVLALALALLLPAFLPNWQLGLVHGSGKGSGGSGGGVTSTLDPLVTLADAVANPTKEQLLSYTMVGGLPETTYLRTGALDEFNGTEWRLSPKEIGDLPERLPDVAGLDRLVPQAEVRSAVTVGGMKSTWLPLPYPAVKVAAPGSWKYEPSTRTVLGENNKATPGLKYEVTSLDVRPTAGQLRAAGPAPSAITSRYLDLPANLPVVVRDTAEGVTRNAATNYDKAVALQNYFVQNFTYTVKVEPAAGNDAIVKFLERRSGFCVHYASTMAAMARALGIPSRVAVGFTPGKPIGPNSFVVTGEEYHAWPELYFEGSGWLRFEPTPQRGSAPGYSAPVSTPTTAPTQQAPTAAPSTTAAPAPSVSSSCDAKLRKLGECPDQNHTPVAQPTQRAWWQSWQHLGIVAGGVVLLALLAAPMLWRAWLRRHRLGAGGRRRPGGGGPAELTEAQVLAAWDELIDSAWDLGIPPDDSRTPRASVRRIAEVGELDEAATAAVGRVALATERVLYARAGEQAPPLAGDVRTAREGLRASAGRAGRARALLLPPSSAKLWWRAADRVMALRMAGRRRVLAVSTAVTGPVRRAADGLRRGRRS